ncbi:beta strand repeat-containing protein, partial [Flavobacterium sp.]|uniref:beta strand repeat-containing protein n=1 Tax=Flavobacterium sp. TaxID=239 RepID=UPI003752A6A8
MRKFYTSVLLIVFLFTSFNSLSQMVAVDDNITTFSGFSSTMVLVVTVNDTFNGTPVTASNTDVTPVTNGPISIDAEGVLTLASNTPSGTYSTTYQICNIGNTDCDTAVVTINVFNSIIAANDSFPPIPSIPNLSILGDVTENDTLNGIPVTFNNTNVTPVVNGPLAIDFNGTITVAPNPAPGTYAITYTVCETGAIPANCDTATAMVVVQSQPSNPIVANDDTFQNINGITGNVNAGNVLSNNGNGADLLNGQPVNLSLITLSVITPAIGSISPSINTSTGVISVPANIPSGTYIITYQICQTSNPTNCDTAIATIIVNSNLIINANNDSASVSNPIANQIVLEDVLNNDTLNGIPVTLTNVTISQTSSTSGFFSIQNNGSVIATSSNVPSGSYTLDYQICQNNAPNNCDTAFVTIDVNNELSATANGTYVDYNNDGFTNIGDVINYTFTVTNNSLNTITNVDFINSPNSPNTVAISGGPLSNLPSQTTNTTTFTGTYVLTQLDITNGYVGNFFSAEGTLNGTVVSIDTYNATTLNISNGIKLNAFIDSDGNGIQNNNEQSFNLGNFTYQINNGTINNLFSDSTIILYESNPANSYNLTFSVFSQFASQYTVSPSTYSNITVAANSGITTYNFPVTIIPFTDLAVYIYQSGIAPRPGFTYYNQIEYSNFGTQPIASGTVTFTNNNVVSVIAVSPTGSVATANGFTYNFTNLLAGETRYMFVTMQVPTIPTVSLGQLLTNTVSITIPSGDINTLNNSSEITQVIVGSYDPNDKTEAHGGKIVHSTFTSNDYLTYTIRFENTGTADAINIRVNDVLDAKLDETSLRMINASHPYVLQRVGTNLNWKFDGVNLPPSNGSETVG